MRREEHVRKPVAAEDDFVAAGQSIDAVEDLIPGVLRDQADERIQADDGLFVQVIENGCCQRIVLGTLPY
jgi:hypothetical protein